VVIDPVDGSTNASRGLPWWAISLCAMSEGIPVAAVVASPRTAERFEAVRGQGARRNGLPIAPSPAQELGQSVVAFNGYPASNYGWGQYRALGAAALDLCAVACGTIDGFVDCSGGGLGALGLPGWPARMLGGGRRGGRGARARPEREPTRAAPGIGRGRHPGPPGPAHGSAAAQLAGPEIQLTWRRQRAAMGAALLLGATRAQREVSR
jgi:hypothetical protein